MSGLSYKSKQMTKSNNQGQQESRWNNCAKHKMRRSSLCFAELIVKDKLRIFLWKLYKVNLVYYTKVLISEILSLNLVKASRMMLYSSGHSNDCIALERLDFIKKWLIESQYKYLYLNLRPNLLDCGYSLPGTYA